MRPALLASLGLFAAGCPQREIFVCQDHDVAERLETRGSESLAADGLFVVSLRPAVEADEWSYLLDVDVTNTTAADCPVAVYVSEVPPDLANAPVLDPEVTLPLTSPVGDLVDYALVSQQWGGVDGRWFAHLDASQIPPSERWVTVVACEGLAVRVDVEAWSCDLDFDLTVKIGLDP